MFDIGWSEMAVILVVALIVIGPKDLPRVARSVGRWVAKGRAMAREFQDAIEDMAREAELDKVKKEIENAGRIDVGKTIERTVDPSGELGKAFDPTADGARKGSKASSKAEPARSGEAKLAKAGEAKPTKVGEAKPAKAAPKPAEAKAEPAQAAKPATPEPVADSDKSSKKATSKPARPNGQAAEREAVPAEPS